MEELSQCRDWDAAGDLAEGEPVAGDLVDREDSEVFFVTRPERVVLVGSEGMVVR